MPVIAQFEDRVGRCIQKYNIPTTQKVTELMDSKGSLYKMWLVYQDSETKPLPTLFRHHKFKVCPETFQLYDFLKNVLSVLSKYECDANKELKPVDVERAKNFDPSTVAIKFIPIKKKIEEDLEYGYDDDTSQIDDITDVRAECFAQLVVDGVISLEEASRQVLTPKRLINLIRSKKQSIQSSQYVRDLTVDGIEPNPGPYNRRNNKKNKKMNNKRKPQQRAQNRRNIGTRNIDRNEPGVRGNEFPLVKRMVQPTTLVQDFIFDIPSTPFNNPGGAIVGETYYSDDGYDWLSSILTDTMQFLNHLFKLYGKAKVLLFSPTFIFTNLEQTELDFYFFSSPESQTALSSSKAAIQSAAATGIYRGSKVMSEQYGKNSKITFRDAVKPGQVIGNPTQFRASDDFAFTQSSNPGRLTYYGWYAVSPINTIAAGLTRRVHIEARLFFYDMLTLSANITKPKPDNWICPRSQRAYEFKEHKE
jgi:hypothetical protein